MMRGHQRLVHNAWAAALAAAAIILAGTQVLGLQLVAVLLIGIAAVILLAPLVRLVLGLVWRRGEKLPRNSLETDWRHADKERK
jgi:hypothetical protein